MPTIYLTTGDAIAVIAPSGDHWQATLHLQDHHTYCVAADPSNPALVYCGTFGQGLWRSCDAGSSWEQAGPGITYTEVMAVAVSRTGQGDTGTVWAGTEPSTLFRSDDGSASWRECPALRELPSAPTWSFPPRPWTHHVRWIAPDAVEPDRIFVGIELGGVVRSPDGGLTWEDRKPNGQHDAHTLRTHPLAPNRVYEAAGGGYAESHDGGASWQRLDEGMAHHYCWSVAVDSAGPDTVIVSATRGPMQAHQAANAEATVYRKTAGQPWRESRSGLPEPHGTRAYALASNDQEPHFFYAATHRGEIFRSEDAGQSWQPLEVDWPGNYRPDPNAPFALVVVGA
jgi:photosystem II stability/assembly factor-like uncharacterized protein